ncbi:hypothetical protein A2761_00065 [Candidatus Kaiserbacteria bacterium RIFCSPHIGHO2_01_FULL_51_33]|nr:MAG: hypothetical protein A2761_00065 [Candidatus Kaiserbacteria bacterium RIFCSPHIGHO2_01_FULL_51_33]
MINRPPARYKRGQLSATFAAGKSGAGSTPYHFSKKSGKGFTLLETIIYIGLSGLILAGILGTVYPLMSGADSISKSVTAEGEALFILRKVFFALSSVSSPVPIAVPSEGESGDTLIVNRFPSGTVIIAQNGDAIEVNGVPITASRVTVTNFRVGHIAPALGVPRYIELEFDANGKHVGPVRKYLHF